MKEIRIHGRGGQGSVTAAELLSVAAFKDGKFSQAFPAFGVERRGAPVQAFTRISNNPIRLRSQIYTPDYVIVQDATLLETVNVSNGIKDDGVIIVNTTEKPESLPINTKAKVMTVDATKVAMDIIGSPIVNAVLLGAFAGATEEIKVESINQAIKARFPGKVGEKNAEAIQKAYDLIRERIRTTEADQGSKIYPGILKNHETRGSEVRCCSVCKPGSALKNKTGGWRNFRPVYNYEKCTKCGICEIVCPDMSVKPRGDGFFEYDYDYCKGCGICANECPEDAIEMILEAK